MPPIPNSRPVELSEGYHLNRTAVFLERTPALRLMKVIPTGMWSPCSHRDATNEPSSTGLFRKRSGCGYWGYWPVRVPRHHRRRDEGSPTAKHFNGCIGGEADGCGINTGARSRSVGVRRAAG
jgi:hypothetical protein